MTLVVDASVAAKWFIQEPETPFADVIRNEESVVAPDLIVAEVMNAAWKHVRLRHISREHAASIAVNLPQAFAALISSVELAVRALEIAVALDHPVYDTFYLAAAERENAQLVTADRRLFQRTRRTRFARLVRPLVR
jgi:predicted nucleic acid-binding protein